jgi:glutathione S-transferase
MLGNGFRYGEGNDFFKSRILTVPEASPGLKAVAQNRLKWLDGQMADGREFLCGKRFTLADILLHCFVTFFAKVGQPVDEGNKHVVAWIERVGARPSAKA